MTAAILVGLFSGFLAGLVGIGGGFIFVPLIMTIYSNVNIHEAIATSSGFAVAAGLSSFVIHIRWASPYINIAAGFLAGSLFGAITGPFISLMIAENILTKLFAAIVILPVLIRTLRFSIKPRMIYIVIMGLLIGCFSSIFGIGGGILLMPLLVQAFNLDLRRSLTTSALFIAVNSAVATTVYACKGFVMWEILFFAAPAGIAGAWLGARVSQKLKPIYIKAALVMLIIGVVVKMLIAV
jgi:uncharacterized protein